jgi:hypothetical protein
VSAAPLRILLSRASAAALASDIALALGGRPHRLLAPGTAQGEVDVAFVSRDVTGLSTKHEVQPATQAFYDALEAAPALRWVHVHSAGADRPVYVRLRERGVQVTTSSGANAAVVAHSALAGLLALARHLPQLWAAQRERTWAPLLASGPAARPAGPARRAGGLGADRPAAGSAAAGARPARDGGAAARPPRGGRLRHGARRPAARGAAAGGLAAAGVPADGSHARMDRWPGAGAAAGPRAAGERGARRTGG